MEEADPGLRGGPAFSSDDKDYHVARARAELDAAYRAERSSVAAVHLKLAAMHMRRAQSLTGRVTELAWLERCAPLHETSLLEAEAG